MSGPSFYGYIRDAHDAEFVFRMAAENRCRKIQKRLHYKTDNIRDGQGYVYDEQQSKIKRWTDGFNWGDSYHPGGKVMIYKEVDIVWEDNKIKKVEKPFGLRKKTIADYNSNTRIVCYYFEKEILNYPPIRMCMDQPTVATKPAPPAPLLPTRLAVPQPVRRSAEAPRQKSSPAPSMASQRATAATPAQTAPMDASQLCVTSLLRAAGCLEGDELPPPPKIVNGPPASARHVSPVSVPPRKRAYEAEEVHDERAHKVMRMSYPPASHDYMHAPPQVMSGPMVPHYDVSSYEHMAPVCYPPVQRHLQHPMPMHMMQPGSPAPYGYPGYHQAMWQQSTMMMPANVRKASTFSIENILCK
eukprot:Opistho-2@67725